MSLHPELQRLEQQYYALGEELRAGNISQDDALRLLTTLVAVDGEGATWSVDPYSGSFLRSFHGGPPMQTDPSLFAPAQLPPVHAPVLPHGTPPSMVSEFQHPALRPLPPEPRAARVKDGAGRVLSGAGSLFARVLAPFGSLLSKHLRTVLMVVAFVAVAAVMLLRSPGSPDTAEPSVVPGGATGSEVTVPPATFPEITLPGEDVAPSAVSAETIAATVSTLTSGDATALQQVLPSDPAVRWSLSPLLGAPRVGLTLTAGEADPGESSTTVPVLVGDPAAPIAVWDLEIAADGRILAANRRP